MIFQFLCQCKTTECITRCDLHNLALLLFLANQPVTVSILGKSMIYEKFPTPTRNRRTAFDCRFLLTRDKMTSQNINSVLIGGGTSHSMITISNHFKKKKRIQKLHKFAGGSIKRKWCCDLSSTAESQLESWKERHFKESALATACPEQLWF